MASPQYLYYPESFNIQDFNKTEQVRSDSTDDEIQFDCYTPKVIKTNICKYKT